MTQTISPLNFKLPFQFSMTLPPPSPPCNQKAPLSVAMASVPNYEHSRYASVHSSTLLSQKCLGDSPGLTSHILTHLSRASSGSILSENPSCISTLFYPFSTVPQYFHPCLMTAHSYHFWFLKRRYLNHFFC